MVTGKTSPDWKIATLPYQHPDIRRSIWQIFNSVGPLILLFALMYFSLKISYWLTLALALPAAGFLVRTFIIFHDSCHGSFFKSKRANRIVGYITGILTFTPYERWQHDHAIHHATAGDLDRRGVGDVMTLTVDEYQALPPIKKLGYRLFRHPLVMFTIGPIFIFVFSHRFALKNTGKRERMSVVITNLALLAMISLLIYFMGWKEYLMVHLPIIVFGTTAGVWLFYVQHNYEGSFWTRHTNWDFATAGLKGSSFYKLPRLLQWFTGNIGFHHVHHLNPRIPNYKLEACYRSSELFQRVKPLTLLASLKSLNLRLWDEPSKRLVSLAALKRRPPETTPVA
jgi:omega-6 fatty acid desaturase (delta-12 desaturase)